MYLRLLERNSLKDILASSNFVVNNANFNAKSCSRERLKMQNNLQHFAANLHISETYQGELKSSQHLVACTHCGRGPVAPKGTRVRWFRTRIRIQGDINPRELPESLSQSQSLFRFLAKSFTLFTTRPFLLGQLLYYLKSHVPEFLELRFGCLSFVKTPALFIGPPPLFIRFVYFTTIWPFL